MTTRRSILQAGMACVVTSSLPAVPASAPGRCFDAMLFEGKPDLGSQFPRMPVIYEGTIWGKDNTSQTLPSEDAWGPRAAAVVGGAPFAVIDIERLPLSGNRKLGDTIRVLLNSLSIARKACPATKFGFYSLVPRRDYWRAIKGPKAAGYSDWQRENDQLRELVQAVDFLAPSLYTFYDDADGWKRYASAQIAECHRLAPGRPVFPFLWPRFHESNKALGNRYMSDELWMSEVRFCRSMADGLIVWGGFKEAWDEKASWWSALKKECGATS